MQYDFLKDFTKRMKHVGLYSLVLSNSSQKQIWGEYGFNEATEQVNLVFAVLQFIMDKSLKEEDCTIDDISAFIDSINVAYFRKNMNFDNCVELGKFIINKVFANNGLPMYFSGYDFDSASWQELNVCYIANRVVYPNGVKRTSYYLTDDGYNLALSTLEVEDNMRLTFQEMVFSMHLKRQSYDQALRDIFSIFNLIRIQIQKIILAKQSIRKNVLEYQVGDYAKLLDEDLEMIDKTKKKFRAYQNIVHSRVRELEKAQIDVTKFGPKEKEKLNYLRQIDVCLGKTLNEYLKIQENQFDLKILYSEELDKLAAMSLIQRFSLQTEIFDKILDDPTRLGAFDSLLMPLFNTTPRRILNLSKVYEMQKAKPDDDEDNDPPQRLDFDVSEWEAEQERIRKEKLKKYEDSFISLLNIIMIKKSVSLSEICETLKSDSGWPQLIPSINIFKEIMVKLLRARDIDIVKLRQERARFIQDELGVFQLSQMLLKLLDEHPEWPQITNLNIHKIPDSPPVVFKDVVDEDGAIRTIRCTNVMMSVEGE